MECEVHAVYKKPRYRILIIGEATYIMDMGLSFWKILFPFFFWMFPNPVFKVDDQDIVEKLKDPGVEEANTGWFSVFGAGVSILLANLLRPLADYFNIKSSPFINSIILVVVLILVFSLGFYIINKSKRNLYKIANPERFVTDRLWIRPKSIKHFFQVLLFYLLFLGSTLLGIVVFIEFGNVIMLFCTTIFLIFLLITFAMTVMVGNTTVKFKGDKKAAV